MKVKIKSTDRSMWFVYCYGVGGLVEVLSNKVGSLYELTPKEFENAKLRVGFRDQHIEKLFIPEKDVEVV